MKNFSPSSALSRALRSLPLVLVTAGAVCADGMGPGSEVLRGTPDGDVVLRTAPSAASLSGSPDGPVAAMPTARDFDMFRQVNRVRAQHGLQPLRYEARLFACAHEHSTQQMRGAYLGHGDRAGGADTFSVRLRRQGYAGRTIAEVVAGDYPQVSDALQTWMGSPAHRDMLLDPDMVEAAFAFVEGPVAGSNRWTGVLADPAGKATPVAPRAAAPVTSAAAPQLPQPATRVSAPALQAPRTPSLAPVRPPLPSAPRTTLGMAEGNLVPPAATSARPAPVMPAAPRVQPLPSAPRAVAQPSVAPQAPTRVTKPDPCAEPWSPNSLPTYIPAPKPKKVQCVGGT